MAWIKSHVKLIIIIMVVLLIAGGVFGYRAWRAQVFKAAIEVEVQDADRLLADPKTHTTYRELESHLKAYRDNPTLLGPRYDVALDYKTLGSLTGEAKYYERSALMYEEIITILGHKSYLPYLNAANVYRPIKKFDLAEKRYREALVIAPGEPSIYLALAEMYRYDLEKPSEEVLSIYRDALQRLTEVENVLLAYASYLRDLGRKQEALEAYEKLEKIHPGAYQSEIQELKQ